MNWKKSIVLSCVVPCVFAVPTATAQMMGHHASTARMAMHGAPVLGSTARMPTHRASMLNSTSGFQRSRGGAFNRDDRSRSFNRFNDGDFDRDDGFRSFNRFNEIIVFDHFGFPFSPFFGSPFYYPYPYYPYGYSYQSGYDLYSYRDGYGVNGSLVVQVQRGLASAGFYSGPIDGVIGSGTRRAIRAYERSHGLPIDGAIHRRLLATMGLA
jgi:Putative peptidoglycan binding domain